MLCCIDKLWCPLQHWIYSMMKCFFGYSQFFLNLACVSDFLHLADFWQPTASWCELVTVSCGFNAQVQRAAVRGKRESHNPDWKSLVAARYSSLLPWYICLCYDWIAPCVTVERWCKVAAVKTHFRSLSVIMYYVSHPIFVKLMFLRYMVFIAN